MKAVIIASLRAVTRGRHPARDCEDGRRDGGGSERRSPVADVGGDRACREIETAHAALRVRVGACGVISEDVAPSGAHAVTGAHVTLTVTRGDDDAVMMM
ncbi:unnamed protein product [Lampetra fluviatilis]